MPRGWNHWPHMWVLLLLCIWRILTVPARSPAGLGLRNAETFALKIWPPEILALLTENSNISAFVSIVLSDVPPLCYRIAGCGFALRNGLCVRVKCIHLFPWVATGNILCMCFGGRGRKDIHLCFLLPTMTQGFHFNKEFLSWQRRKTDGPSLSA